jgi:hypothetical protein
MIHIPLDLSRHCIQTEARRQYNRLLSTCLKSADGDDRAEKKLELLRKALETFDFPRLRADYRELAGGQAHEVVLMGDGTGPLSLIIDGRTVVI